LSDFYGSNRWKARAYLQQTLDRAVAMADEAARVDDPMAGLAQFLEQALELMAANRGLFDVLINGYDADWFKNQMQGLITGPIRHLVVRGQQAGVVRPELSALPTAVATDSSSGRPASSWDRCLDKMNRP
jgi:hypothetical protein